jgi:hypothetical protein
MTLTKSLFHFIVNIITLIYHTFSKLAIYYTDKR